MSSLFPLFLSAFQIIKYMFREREQLWVITKEGNKMCGKSAQEGQGGSLLKQPRDAGRGPQHCQDPRCYPVSTDPWILPAANRHSCLSIQIWLTPSHPWKTRTEEWIPAPPWSSCIIFQAILSFDSCSFISPGKGICDSFWKQEHCGCWAHSPGCWLRFWADTGLEGSPVMGWLWCNRASHHQPRLQFQLCNRNHCGFSGRKLGST